MAFEQARFETARARRQYDAVDPENRLVAAELERRWNEALKQQGVIEHELSALRADQPSRLSETVQERIVQLGEDLPALWNHPKSAADLKKRILRTVIHEIVVRRDGDKISMLLHWQGGDHTSIEFLRSKTGQHRWTASEDLITLVRELARVQSDQGITASLNRLGKRTPHGHTWTEARLRTFRNDHQITAYSEVMRSERGDMTLDEAAKTLGVSTMTVRRMIDQKILSAEHACSGAPWIIRSKDIQRIAARPALKSGPRTADTHQILLQFE